MTIALTPGQEAAPGAGVERPSSGNVKETHRWQLPASSPAAPACKSRQKALWGQQADIYFIFQNVYSSPAPTRPSYPALDGNG